MKTLIVVAGVVGVIVLLVAIWLSTGPRLVAYCTCGEPDCEGGCLNLKRRPTGTR